MIRCDERGLYLTDVRFSTGRKDNRRHVPTGVSKDPLRRT
jgi:hypothetical protein